MHPKSFICLAFLLVSTVFAQTSTKDLSVALQLESRRYLVGEPIMLRASVRNVSDKTLYLAYGEHGFISFPIMESLSGNVGPLCPPQDVKKVEWGEGYKITPLAPGASLERSETVCDFTRVFAKPGRYKIFWRAESLGPYEKRVAKKVIETYPQAWTGMIDSTPIEIEIMMPMGTDREAFDRVIQPAVQDTAKVPGVAVWVEKVLEKYPTSTYAGYGLGPGEGFDIKLDSKPEFVVRTLCQENYLRQNPMASIHRRVEKQGKVEVVLDQVPMMEQLQNQRAKIEAFLKNHPDFARREILEMSRAYQSLALGDQSTACLALEWVSKSAPSQQWRTQADAILDKITKSDKSKPSSPPQVREKP